MIRLYENTGKVTPKHHGGRAIAKIQVEDLPIVEQLVSEQPDALLVELCERLALRRGLQVSVPTMHRTYPTLDFRDCWVMLLQAGDSLILEMPNRLRVYIKP